LEVAKVMKREKPDCISLEENEYNRNTL